jgi:hypothetical protein
LGWTKTTGGAGGQIIHVTNLKASGSGSFRAAIETKGARIIVFDAGGIINLNRNTLVIAEPKVTVAGQTAPSPGITLIRGGLDIVTHDVIVQHLHVRPGDVGAPKLSGWEEDGMSTRSGAYDVIVDHCSFSWATDENLSASGSRFVGNSPDEWRNGTSHRITYSFNIIAEGLADATHTKGEHSKGSLIHDNVTDILIIGNLYAQNMERSPLFKGGARGAIVNNLIYAPGLKAIHYNLLEEEWGDHPRQVGEMSIVGNVVRAGPSTREPIAMLMLGGSGELDYFLADNIAVDQLGRPLPQFGSYTTSSAKAVAMSAPPTWPQGLEALPASVVQDWVLHNAGARPWDRDAEDWRIVADTIEGRGRIISSQDEVGGYPDYKPSVRRFDEAAWDLEVLRPKSGMP